MPRNRYTRKKQKGRGFVSKGTYGCVYKPPLKCEGNTSRKTNGISKLMYMNNADDEFEATPILETVDPAKKYFLTATRICDPAAPEQSNGVDSSTCDLLGRRFRSNLANAKLVEYPYGGIDLSKFKPHVDNYYVYFEQFAHLLEGLVALHAKGYAHLDIKDQNILADRLPMPAQGEQEIHMKFIDFGFLSNKETFYTKLSPSMRFWGYAVWPFDIGFAYRQADGMKPTLNYYAKYYKNVYDFAEVKVPNKSIYYVYPGVFFNSLDKLTIEDLTTFYANYTNLAQTDKDRVALLMPTIDIFMMGALMSMEFTRFLFIYQKKDGTLDIKDHTLALTLNQINWINEVLTKIATPLFVLLNKMMNVDFTKRISAAKALEEYTPILTEMKTLFTEKNIKDYLKKILNLSPRDPRPAP